MMTVVVNCRSIKGKKVEVNELIDSLKPHIIFATETHLDDNFGAAEFFPPTYAVYRKDRNKHGGGVLIAVNSGMNTYELKDISADIGCVGHGAWKGAISDMHWS